MSLSEKSKTRNRHSQLKAFAQQMLADKTKGQGGDAMISMVSSLKQLSLEEFEQKHYDLAVHYLNLLIELCSENHPDKYW